MHPTMQYFNQSTDNVILSNYSKNIYFLGIKTYSLLPMRICLASPPKSFAAFCKSLRFE